VLKVLAIAVSIVVTSGSLLACGQDDSRVTGQAALDQTVPGLPSGLSIEKVEGRLGEPRARFETEDGEIGLIYGFWHLVFDPFLFERIRFYIKGYWPGDRPVAPLDRKIRMLKVGSSRPAVEGDIGKTEAWEIFNPGANELLWYGNGRWKLHFSDRRLSGKVLYINGSPSVSHP